MQLVPEVFLFYLIIFSNNGGYCVLMTRTASLSDNCSVIFTSISLG